MRWASALSRKSIPRQAVAEASDQIDQQLGGAGPDLVVVFAAFDDPEHLSQLPALLSQRWPTATVVGCTGGGVIAAGEEVEAGQALSLTAAVLPGVELRPFHVEEKDLPAGEGTAGQWRALCGVDPSARPSFIVLADAFTIDPDALVAGLDGAYPGAVKVGGLASGGLGPGENRLFVHGEAKRSGAMGLALTGNVQVQTVVAQGCRPIGAPMLITDCKHHVVRALDQRRPLDVLEEVYASLPPEDQELFQHSLFVGVEMGEDDVVQPQAGDFLVRNVIGIDPDHGAMAIAAHPRPFQVLQFHLRDARTAKADVESRLDRLRDDPTPSGVLLFSCLGRGEHLFGCQNHDTSVFRKLVGEVPIGGFFCNGEIGPVGGRTFLHGYTSAFALFRPRAQH